MVDRVFGPSVSPGIPISAGSTVKFRVRQASGSAQTLSNVRFGIMQVEPQGQGLVPLPSSGDAEPVPTLPTEVALIGNQTGQINRSIDGDTWLESTTPGSDRLRGLGWSGQLEQFVAVGHGGVLWTGTADGETWTAQSSAVSANLNSVAWSPKLGLWLVVGDQTLLTSLDGETWTSQSSSIDRFWETVIWVEELEVFVVAGSAGNVLFSDDGEDFQVPTVTGGSIVYGALAWSPSVPLIVAVGQNGNVMTSPNAVDWTDGDLGHTDFMRGAAWSQTLGLFAIAGDGGTVQTSPDGVNWTTRSTSGSTAIPSLAWFVEGEIFFGGRGNSFIWSTDGETWTTEGGLSMPGSGSFEAAVG